MSDSVQPHRRQPTRLPHPWDSPGKSTGVGCHFLLQCMKVKSESEVAQSCSTLSNPMNCSPPGSSVHGIFQARVLELVAIAFSKESYTANTNSLEPNSIYQTRQQELYLIHVNESINSIHIISSYSHLYLPSARIRDTKATTVTKMAQMTSRYTASQWDVVKSRNHASAFVNHNKYNKSVEQPCQLLEMRKCILFS